MLRDCDAAQQVQEIEVDHSGGTVRVVILKISSAMGSFAGFGFTIPQLLMEGGGYSSEQMAIAAVKLFLSAMLALLAVFG